MDFIAGFNDIRLFQWIAMITAASLAVVMLIIKVPQTEHASRLTRAKSIVALSYLFCAFIFGYTLLHHNIADYQFFSALTMLINVAFSATTLSFSLINLLGHRYIDFSKLLITLFAIFLVSMGLVELFFNGEKNMVRTALIASVVLYSLLCIYYIIIFDRWYKHSIMMLEKYYDEDEEHKLKWVKFCFILAMLTDMFVLVYLVFLKGFMFIYIGFYILFLLYFAGNFISFLGSHKLLLDAFGHYTISQKEKAIRRKRKTARKKTAENVNAQTAAFNAISKSLDEWVRQKKFRECDKSREEIAEEIGTTKELLNQYFAQVLGKDFRTWRTELRIEDAKSLLLSDRKMSSNLIGEMVGFSDRSNFHRQFTKLVGCSPRQWREMSGEPESAAE